MQYRTGFCAFCCPPPLFGALHTGLPPCFWLCRLIGRTAILSDGFRGRIQGPVLGGRFAGQKNIVENPYGFPLPSLILLPISFLFSSLILLPISFLFTYKNILLYIYSLYIYLLLYIVCIYIIYYNIVRERARKVLCYTRQ